MAASVMFQTGFFENAQIIMESARDLLTRQSIIQTANVLQINNIDMQ
jgi:hypothetical protein